MKTNMRSLLPPFNKLIHMTACRARRWRQRFLAARLVPPLTGSPLSYMHNFCGITQLQKAKCRMGDRLLQQAERSLQGLTCPLPPTLVAMEQSRGAAPVLQVGGGYKAGLKPSHCLHRGGERVRQRLASGGVAQHTCWEEGLMSNGRRIQSHT